MIKFILLALLAACAHAPKGTHLASLPKGLDYRLKQQQVSDLSEARKIIQNKRNYLVSLFAQSTEPYYGTARWTEECLKQNVIGEIQESASGVFFVSDLVLDQRMNPGFCRTGSVFEPSHASYYVVHFFCSGEKQLNSLTIPVNSSLTNFNWTQLCR